MVFSSPLGEKPRRAESFCPPARARGRCLWPPPGDFERTPRSRTQGGELGEDMRGPVPGSDSQFLPAFLPPPFHPGFLPSFQSVELLSRQVRSLDIRVERVGGNRIPGSNLHLALSVRVGELG
uniref:Uncharacterized protein n=1 Tax=Ursus americanus TaxID=9643 RepID=A0A452R7Z9_URSAM